jgi:tRNA threonylcarbamoyladenosine modification (KEOPS) complex Cgi121 subunit
MRELVDAAGKLGSSLVLSPPAARTLMELRAAFLLARGAFAEGKNISSKLSNEALLFLACETNFSSALRKIGAADPSDFVLVCEEKIPVAKLKKELKLISAQSLKPSEWGEKKGKYSEGELAIERMATARIRN